MMLDSQPKNAASVLHMQDVQQMTPLHHGAMFDHVDIVQYLLDQGSNIDARDKEGRSAVLLAASRSAWRAVTALIDRGCRLNEKDDQNRNILHFVVMNGGDIDALAVILLRKEDFSDKKLCECFLNERDATGCTPLHYASRAGHLKSLENLIRLGAQVNLKDKDDQSPLHFAARYGRRNTCRRLLDSSSGQFIMNETDGSGRTALHIAAEGGHVKVVQLLMQRGALVHTDHAGRSPLHLAAASGYTWTIKQLLAVHAHLLDKVDKDGNTALHLAAENGQSRAVQHLLDRNASVKVMNDQGQTALGLAVEMQNAETASTFINNCRWHEIMNAKCGNLCVMGRMIQHLPEVAAVVLDKCHTTADAEDAKAENFYVRISTYY
ncbi:PREDICTED: transient receptor potential cation channel subfamily A member 1-like [Priapulus caudatus]|uniref:Transient receptor potential cation channel subfamily A member 1-like n=1 Tax=Priapulus caudatus TaxID=37621 RepID=A0ABM1EXT5_PRICU|nr:PREDICTED: transient receptor potential cation channel subfamily A member 1-like [Priapulus caudatus]